MPTNPNAAVGKTGYGVRFQRDPGASPGAIEDVGQILELSGPNMSRTAVDVSHSLSPGRYMEFIGGMRDGGEMNVGIALVPSAVPGSQHKKCVDDFNNDERVDYRFMFPDGDTVWEFAGLLTSLPHSTPFNDTMRLDLTIKISGEPVLRRLSDG